MEYAEYFFDEFKKKSKIMDWIGIDPLIVKHVYVTAFVEGDNYREDMIAQDKDYLLELLQRIEDEERDKDVLDEQNQLRLGGM